PGDAASRRSPGRDSSRASSAKSWVAPDADANPDPDPDPPAVGAPVGAAVGAPVGAPTGAPTASNDTAPTSSAGGRVESADGASAALVSATFARLRGSSGTK